VIRTMFRLFSGLSFALALAIAVLWIRSYSREDQYLFPGSLKKQVFVESTNGFLIFRMVHKDPGNQQLIANSLQPDLIIPYVVIASGLLILPVAFVIEKILLQRGRRTRGFDAIISKIS
jgi:hypothetical protein